MIYRRPLILTSLLFAGALSHAATHEYRVSVNEDMSRLNVEARFAAPVGSITARSSDAGRFLTDARQCDSNQRIRMRNRRMLLPRDGVVCIRYEVDLEYAARSERRNTVLDDSNIIVSPTVWFWRPALRNGDDIEVRFELAGALGVSVPWQVMPGEENAFILRDSPESSQALAAFGQFRFAERQIAGATLRITLLQPDGSIDADGVIDWVTSAAENVNLAYGRFPNPSPNIILLPVGNGWNHDAAVHFGRVVRDGGETVELLINENRPVSEYYDNWTGGR